MNGKTIVRYFASLMVAIMLMAAVPMLPGSITGSSGTVGLAVTAEAAVVYYPKCASKYSSIVDALKSIGVDSSYSNRKSIAQINGISNYTGTASQNNTLLNLLKQGRLIKSKTNNPSIALSTGNFTLDLNGTKSKVITVSHQYSRSCCYSWETSGNNNYARMTWGSWINNGTACPLTVQGQSKGSFRLRVHLKDWSTKSIVASTGWINITVTKSTVTTNGATAIYNKAYSQLGKKQGDYLSLGFHRRAWCADFVSWCARCVGQSNAIPWKAAVADLRTAIKNAGGKEYSKATIQKGNFTPKRGDIIIFKSNGASHVGIVNYKSGNYIYYIDGNNTSNGNDAKSCVHYSSTSIYNSRFTCVLRPKYR